MRITFHYFHSHVSHLSLTSRRRSVMGHFTSHLQLPTVTLFGNSVWSDSLPPATFPISSGLPRQPWISMKSPLLPGISFGYPPPKDHSLTPPSVFSRGDAGWGKEGTGRAVWQIYFPKDVLFNACLVLGVVPPVQANHDYRLFICSTGKPKMIREREKSESETVVLKARKC